MRFSSALLVFFLAFVALSTVAADDSVTSTAVAAPATPPVNPAIEAFARVDPERDPAPAGFAVFRTWTPASCGAQVKSGDEIHLMYTARFAPDTPAGTPNAVFDQTTTPVVLHVRGDALITGLYRGLLGSCTRERRRIVIPALWAYGPQGFMDVPGNAKVVFDVDVFDTHPLTDVFGEMDTDRDGCVELAEISSWVIRQGVHESQAPAVSARMLAHDDDNKDGRLTCDEFSGSKICRDHRHRTCARRVDPEAAAVEDVEAQPPAVVDRA